MKKVLLGTTALVAAGAFAGAAQADEMMGPIKANVGGYYNIALIATSGNTGERGHGINQNIEVQVDGSTTLDNGITAGVRIRLIGNNFGEGATSNTDETEVSFSGAFGAVHAGTVEGAAQLATLWAPGASWIGGVKSPWFGAAIAGWTTGAMDEDALKVSYFSPSFNGFTFSLSYAPENSTLSYAGRKSGEANQYGEGIQSAIGYTIDVMGGSFSTNIGYETYTSEFGGANPTAMRYGATLSIDQVSIGGAVQTREAYVNPKGVMLGDQTLSDVGIGWSQGPLALGVQYGSHETEGGSTKNITAVSAGYNLGPGVDLGAKFNFVDDGGADATEALFGTSISF